MELITTHINADFDAVASMLAASKLYPEARLAFPGSLERNVREYFAHVGEPFPHVRLKKLNLAAVTRLILVDAKRAGRLGPLKEVLANPGLEIHIYDHHPAHPKDITGTLEVLKEVGATATIFVELLRERRVPLTPEEATLLALGIYEETGFFTFTSTTPADLAAGAALVDQGANLNTVADFIRREMTAEQVALLNELIQAAETHVVNGVPVVITAVTRDRYVGDLAFVVHKLRDIENINVLFVLVRMDNRVHLVARSRLEAVDVGSIAAALGGGGHGTAASATIRERPLLDVKAELLRLLRARVRPVRLARDIMLAPVKAIPDRFTVAGAAAIMNRFSLNTLPVVRRGELTGLITREILDRALYHGLGEAPVSEYMTTEFSTVGPDAPLEKVQALMVEQTLGFLPVVQGKRLMGAILRSDLLRHLHEEVLQHPTFAREEEAEGPAVQPAGSKVSALLRGRLPPRLQEILKAAGGVADQAGARLYAVGGFVRDLLLGVENFDVDLVVEGDGIAFAEAFAAGMGGKVRSHRKFGTAVVSLPDGLKVDVASARTEYYEHPAALPTVEHSSIRMDLYRRDFTINALAVGLNAADYGRLLDFFGGSRDLRDGVIRVIHSLSFVEDPTRILRAARFAVRYGFTIAKQSDRLIRNAVRLRLLDRLSGARILTELKLIFQEARPAAIVKMLEGYGVPKAIHPRMKGGQAVQALLEKVGEVLSWYRLLHLPQAPTSWLLYLLAWVSDCTLAEARSVGRRLGLPPGRLTDVSAALSAYRALRRQFARERPLTPGLVTRLLEDAPLEAILLLMVRAPAAGVEGAVSDYLTRYARVRPLLTGNDLKALGIRPGPIYRNILASLRYARLDGKLTSRDEEEQFVRRRFAAHVPAAG
ncbi:MAG TPA: CBS domain-containing protein [Candidatus Methylomirabilis sp.]|jgi:tRNA nucleotidyltransferase (CCA-adding enzyme)|nr:CBS domain-containing protein [Candidatus Methylomirabilis sp.]